MSNLMVVKKSDNYFHAQYKDAVVNGGFATDGTAFIVMHLNDKIGQIVRCLPEHQHEEGLDTIDLLIAFTNDADRTLEPAYALLNSASGDKEQTRH